LKVIAERRQHFWRDGIETQVLSTGDNIKVQNRRRQKQGKAEPALVQIGGRLNCDVIQYARPS